MSRPFPSLAAFALFAAVLSACSPALRRPLIAEGEEPPMAGFYARTGGGPALPKTNVECETYLSKHGAAADDLVAAVCNLNLNRSEEAGRLAAGLSDTCYGKVLRYDLDVDGRMPKADRMSRLQSLLDCSARPDYLKMIQARAKLAHYE
jgi:hypothetical protein